MSKHHKQKMHHLLQLASRAHADELPGRPKIVFLHVMKTAGTSLGQWIAQHYNASEVLTEASVWKELLGLPEHVLRQKRFIRGHFGSYAANYFGPKQGFHIITVLRHPVARVLSHFWHCKRAPDNSTFSFVRDDQFTFDDFLQDARTRPLASNYQTANFAYELDRDYGTPWLAPHRIFHDGLSGTHHKRAREFLDNCTIVGLAEDFPGLMRRVSERFGFHSNERFAKTRSYQPQDFEITQDQRQKIEQLNQMDIDLYEWANGLNAKPPPSYSYPNVTNPLNCQRRKATWLPHRPFWGEGWSDIQSLNEPPLLPHRWSLGTAPATIEFDCDSGRICILRFRIVRFVSAAQSSGLTIFADDKPLAARCVRADEGDGALGGGIYSVRFRSTRSRVSIRFGVKTAMSFKEVNPEDLDDTPRGFALAWASLVQR